MRAFGEVNRATVVTLLDRARIVLDGTDVTLLCYGPMVRTCA